MHLYFLDVFAQRRGIILEYMCDAGHENCARDGLLGVMRRGWGCVRARAVLDYLYYFAYARARRLRAIIEMMRDGLRAMRRYRHRYAR
ncbi:MAG: hypothetical protein M0R66_03030 [Candidatus Omnitrophica bacterium]|nr:hypothetical protein [Candidatus Omnitrophota bacterium]